MVERNRRPGAQTERPDDRRANLGGVSPRISLSLNKDGCATAMCKRKSRLPLTPPMASATVNQPNRTRESQRQQGIGASGRHGNRTTGLVLRGGGTTSPCLL
jgi:hypothetical protein